MRLEGLLTLKEEHTYSDYKSKLVLGAARIAESIISRSAERSFLHKLSRDQLRKMLDINLWLLNSYAHTFTPTYTHTHTTLNYSIICIFFSRST